MCMGTECMCMCETEGKGDGECEREVRWVKGKARRHHNTKIHKQKKAKIKQRSKK